MSLTDHRFLGNVAKKPLDPSRARRKEKAGTDWAGPGEVFDRRGKTNSLLTKRSGLQSRHSFDRTDGVVEQMAGYGVSLSTTVGGINVEVSLWNSGVCRIRRRGYGR